MGALYTNSLQTTVMCKMTSKVASPPTNNTNTIFSANIPTVCNTDDNKQFNTQLTAKSETCVPIGGGSSRKVNCPCVCLVFELLENICLPIFFTFIHKPY